MAAITGSTVKDVPAHEFVRAYAAHLKRTGKVWLARLSSQVESLMVRRMTQHLESPRRAGPSSAGDQPRVMEGQAVVSEQNCEANLPRSLEARPIGTRPGR